MSDQRAALTAAEAHRLRRAGFVLCLVSASGFASLAVFGKQAYAAGFDPAEVLAVRFLIAAPVLAAIALALRKPLALPRRTAARLFAMGAFGYAIQASLFFTAVSRISASLAGLLLYVYPALVTAGAVLLGRHRATRLTAVGLACALGGTALIVGVPAGKVDALGIAIGLMAALWYASYILVGERALTDADPLVTSAYVCAGAAASFVVVGGAVLRLLDFDGVDWGAGWAPLLGIAILGTALAIATLFAGMAVIGSTWASITSSFEPVFTVVLSVAFLREDLTWGMAVGGTMVVLGAVVLPLVGTRNEAVAPPA